MVEDEKKGEDDDEEAIGTGLQVVPLGVKPSRQTRQILAVEVVALLQTVQLSFIPNMSVTKPSLELASGAPMLRSSTPSPLTSPALCAENPNRLPVSEL